MITVDPTAIRGYLPAAAVKRIHADTGRAPGSIVDGDWDRFITLLDVRSADFFVSCEMRWLEGAEWEHTPMFQDYVARMNDAGMERFPTHQHLVDRYHALDAIYARVCRDRAMGSEPEHLLRINIDRNGGMAFGPDGRHRLAIALIAGLDTIPGRVGYVHANAVDAFQALRSQRRR